VTVIPIFSFCGTISIGWFGLGDCWRMAALLKSEISSGHWMRLARILAGLSWIMLSWDHAAAGIQQPLMFSLCSLQ
jgi:hypothetical protein